MKESERISLMGIVNHFLKVAKNRNMNMESCHAQLSSWGESESLSVTLYSKDKTNNGHSVISISADTNADNYSLRVLEMKLMADYAERLHELGLPTPV